MECCFHNLISYDSSAIDEKIINDEEIMTELATKSTDDGILGMLDQPYLRKFAIPRAMPLVKKQVKTKWTVFAKSKNISSNKHRNRLVYDKSSNDYKLRWGGRSLKHAEDKKKILIEHKANSKSFDDPFKVRKNEKNLVKTKQKIREEKNKLRRIH